MTSPARDTQLYTREAGSRREARNPQRIGARSRSTFQQDLVDIVLVAGLTACCPRSAGALRSGLRNKVSATHYKWVCDVDSCAGLKQSGLTLLDYALDGGSERARKSLETKNVWHSVRL